MSEKLQGFIQAITEQQLNVISIRILQKGHLLAHWDRDTDQRRVQHSISKSFTCMAVGLALEEGLIHLDATLGDYFTYNHVPIAQDHLPSPRELKLRDLLRMSSGHDSPPLWADERASLTEKDWVKHYMSLPLDRMPGEQFTYSSGDTFMISAMLQAATGQTVKDYLTPRLFEPLGIHDVEWETSPLGVTLGCAGLWISNEELSRFGQLLLQKGLWEGTQLVPADWIREATSQQIETTGDGDWGKGYGYQFWMCSHDAYRADGAYGQLCIILPSREAVICINSEEDNIQGILDAVWDKVLPTCIQP
ncbi:serine hydrolase domain-containing protein [Paenibacillus amylolyticus]|uniref:Beta-lactamase n=1 Tax=Paenibacillus amylolyticus TaxID=1451 RepID=A0A100VIV1_PAEAM|nr:serine hydrolase [Paenibacillus amylolyticus]GAS80632.1 beta-lactamase [Paenibacillus amylolyticus]